MSNYFEHIICKFLSHTKFVSRIKTCCRIFLWPLKKMGKERKEKSIQQWKRAHLYKCIIIKLSYNSPILFSFLLPGAFLFFLFLLILYECFVTITCTCKNEIRIVTTKQKINKKICYTKIYTGAVWYIFTCWQICFAQNSKWKQDEVK